MSRQRAVTAGYRGGRSFACHSESGHDSIVDADVERGGLQHGADPEEVLLMALASSIGIEVVAQLEATGQKAATYRVQAKSADGLAHISLEHVGSASELTADVLEHAVAQASAAPGWLGRLLGAAVTISQSSRVEAGATQTGATSSDSPTARPEDWFR
jgi:uncharacterized OsmC-like protein